MRRVRAPDNTRTWPRSSRSSARSFSSSRSGRTMSATFSRATRTWLGRECRAAPSSHARVQPPSSAPAACSQTQAAWRRRCTPDLPALRNALLCLRCRLGRERAGHPRPHPGLSSYSHSRRSRTAVVERSLPRFPSPVPVPVVIPARVPGSRPRFPSPLSSPLACPVLVPGSRPRCHPRSRARYSSPLACPHCFPPLSLWSSPQVFVEAMDKCFENVCELDLIFHVDKVILYQPAPK